LEGTEECRFTKMNATRLEQLNILFKHLEYSTGDFEDECGNFYIPSWSLTTMYRCLFSAWLWNLDSHIYLRSINKVWIYLQQLYYIEKVVSASAIHTITKLLTVHKLWVKYFFAHRGHLFMILISESCCGRQKVSLKNVIHRWVSFIATYKRIRVNKVQISFLFYTYLPTAIFHSRWITLSSLAHTYVYDLHLIVSKFKAIR